MGQSRLELQELLEGLVGSSNVYFQPPASIEMKYPCIVYQNDYAITKAANNAPYLHVQRYLVTVIDRNPDGPIRAKVAALPLCLYNRGYSVDGLNHDAFKLYF